MTSQLTQPAAFAVCHASGSAVATIAALTAPCAQSVRPIAAVPTSSAAFSSVSQIRNLVIIAVCAAIASWWWSIASRTYASSSASRANSFTVRMFV